MTSSIDTARESHATWLMIPTGRRTDRPTPARFVALFLPLVLLLGPAQAAAPAETEAAALLRLEDVGRGELLLNSDREGLYRPAPLLLSQMRVKVSGLVARVVVRQSFRNPTGDWLEGRYVYPGIPQMAMSLFLLKKARQASLVEQAMPPS